LRAQTPGAGVPILGNNEAVVNSTVRVLETDSSAQSVANADPRSEPHAAQAPLVAEALGVNPAAGLGSAEVEVRRARYGTNAIQTIRPRSAWRILFDQFASLVVALLAAAAIVAWATSDLVEALAILVVLVVNALVGFATEWQAGRALDALRRQARTIARVRRGGREATVDAVELVPGDVVILNAGDRVPADARLIEAPGLRTEESALTGESATVEKSTEPVAAAALLAERHSMLYLGTSIAAGRALAIVTATGAATELGRIGRLVASAPDEATPLERRLGQLGRRLVYIVLGIAAVVMITGWLRGDGLWVMVEVAISLAVAAVPEGLPAVTTLILALGVLRMARERAIVRRLPAVETLGSTTIICTDKTGTLTENRMTVREYRLADGRVRKPDGQRLSLADDELLTRAVRTGVLCNEAAFDHESDAQTIGDPTETALLSVAHQLGVDIVRTRRDYPKLAERPFDAVTKWMVTLHRAPDGSRLAALKGAPSVVLSLCTHFAVNVTDTQPLDEQARQNFLAINEEMAGRALRVLALACKEPAANSSDITDPEFESDYVFLGFVGMSDPPRAEVPEAIDRAHAAGIRVVMLTGDQINTAKAIARELRLSGDDEPHALHARDLEGADQGRIAELAGAADVFARVSPEDKLNIVAALQQAGEIVAVTGDGVNDAPALKRADIGVAMGLRGNEVAKEAADVVLADDNFATILRAVEGGRTIYANIIKFVHMMFSQNLAEVLVIFVAVAAGWPLPLLPLQILWVNLVTDVFPALALAVEPASPGVMQRLPRSPQATLLSGRFLFLIGWQSIVLATITLGAYAWALNQYGEGAHERTVALLALVGVQLGHTFNCRSRTRSVFAGLFRNPFLWVAAAMVIALQLLAVYLKPLARVLGTEQPTAADWVVTGLSIILPVVIVEIVKLFARRAGTVDED